MLLILGLFLLRESRLGYATGLERGFSDWLARNADLRDQEAPLTLIEINDGTLSDSRTWPLPPIDFALFLKAGISFHPSLLAIGEVLNWPVDKQNPDPNLSILHDQILSCPKLVLGAQLGFPNDPDLLPPLQNVPALRQVQGDIAKVAEYPIVEQLPSEELRLSVPLGFTNLPVPEMPVRSVPLVFRYCGQVVPSFVLQSAMLWLQLTPDDIQVHIGSVIKMGDKLEIPIDDSGMMSINPHSRFSRIGLDELLVVVSQIEAKQTPLVKAESLKDKVLLLARTDSGARTFMFPSGHKGTSGELLASAIATIQNQQFPERSPLWADFLIIGGVLVFACYLYELSGFGAVFATLLALPIYLMGAITLYAATVVWVPVVLPFGLLAFALILRLTSPSVVSEKAR